MEVNYPPSLYIFKFMDEPWKITPKDNLNIYHLVPCWANPGGYQLLFYKMGRNRAHHLEVLKHKFFEWVKWQEVCMKELRVYG